MRKFSVTVIIVFASIFAANFTAFAQGPASSKPAESAAPAAAAESHRADDIIERYIQAIGGAAAWEKLHSRTSLGTIDIPAMNLSGTVMIHEKAPNKSLIAVIIAGSAFRQGFDGTMGWSDDPQNGLQMKSGAELLEAKRDADFYHPLDLHKLYAKFTFTGTEKIDAHDAYVVEATLPEGGADEMYFDAQSGLVVRVVSQHHMDGRVSTFTEDIGDYREVDGIKLPFTIHQSSAESSFTIKFGEVLHNVDLNDAEFARPAAR
ncbi:MAG: hypothetical protein ACRD4S_00340 [Candidatus Acidiferrales bacterium]